MHTTRFAPSPTGPLHLGHAYAALFAQAAADAGPFLLRIEDLDSSRTRARFIEQIEADLHWLGLRWREPALRQSSRGAAYRDALEQLARWELTYPCFCTRREIVLEGERAGQAPHGTIGADGARYPGTCRRLSSGERARRCEAGEPFALRLDVARAVARSGELQFEERGSGAHGERGVQRARPEQLGDIVLARKGLPAAYHLAVVLDDAYQGVTLVTRGQDLFPATHVQRLLQALLGLPTPLYAHHRLITDERGRKLSKRDQPATLQSLRAGGVAAADVRRRLGFD